MAEDGIRWRVDWLHHHPEEDIVVGRPAQIIDVDGKELVQYRHVLHPQFSVPKKLSLGYFQQGGLYPVMAWLFGFRRELFTRVGYFQERYRVAQDLDFLFRVLSHQDIPLVFKPVVHRRLHDSNLSLEKNEKEFQLTQETQRECSQILAQYQIKPDHFHLWECSYGL